MEQFLTKERLWSLKEYLFGLEEEPSQFVLRVKEIEFVKAQ